MPGTAIITAGIGIPGTGIIGTIGMVPRLIRPGTVRPPGLSGTTRSITRPGILTIALTATMPLIITAGVAVCRAVTLLTRRSLTPAAPGRWAVRPAPDAALCPTGMRAAATLRRPPNLLRPAVQV